MAIIIYTKTDCPYCDMAKQYLRELGIPYTEFVYDDHQQRQVMYDELGLMGNERTVPQIFGTDRRIGGYADLLRSDLMVSFGEDF